MPTYQKQAARRSSTTTTQAQQPKKRKLGKDMPKYYAVRVGYRPGVYLTWPDCEVQTTGFKGAQYKSFLTREDAQAFVDGKNPGGPSDQSEKWYGVAIGSKPGVYNDWSEAQKAYAGVKGPKYRKFLTRAEAEAFVRTYGNPPASGQGDGDEDDEDDEDEEEDEDEDELLPVAKKRKTSASTASRKVLDIYTDGSSLRNGRAGAVAGIGVFFGKGDPRNVSERLQGDVQTNQRAELAAILRALEMVDWTQGVQIFSDSKYSISCVTDWYRSWEKSGWKTREGEVVKNQDLVRAIRAIIEERDIAGSETRFTWLKGHASNTGNIAADGLAVAGAKISR